MMLLQSDGFKRIFIMLVSDLTKIHRYTASSDVVPTKAYERSRALGRGHPFPPGARAPNVVLPATLRRPGRAAGAEMFVARAGAYRVRARAGLDVAEPVLAKI